jgi:hypothetical protein
MQILLKGLKRAMADIEPLLGSYVCLTIPGYTDEPEVVALGTGVYTASDWSQLRKDGSPSFGTSGIEFEDDDKYLHYIFGLEGMNVVGAILLAKAFDFTRYQSVLEIGCGAMAQAYVLHKKFPHIRYLATDLDPFVIDRCAQLPILTGIEKKVLNVLSLNDVTLFDDVDLLMSWGMEYALNDDELLRLLTLVAQANIPYLMCSATTIGLLKYVLFLMRYPQRARLLAERRLRVTGWHRSVGKYRYLARAAGLKIQPLGRFGNHFCMLFAN